MQKQPQNNVLDILDNLDNNNSYTNQIYSFAYILILNYPEFQSYQKQIVDIIIDSFKKYTLSSENYSFFVEGHNFNNYFISHHYNFIVNLLMYRGLNIYYHSHTYRNKDIQKIIKELNIFLNFEQSQLTHSNHKTIGFELVAGEYIKYIKNFKNQKFKSYIQKTRLQRLKNSSKILAFTPEGLPKLLTSSNSESNLLNKIQPNQQSGIYIFNSPDLTLTLFDKLSPDIQREVMTTAIENKGFPPFFKGEYYDLFWIIDILNSSDNLSQLIQRKLTQLIKSHHVFENELGTFDKIKGIAIARGFELYDIDTTSMLIKSIYYLKLPQIEFKFSYYKNNRNNLYYTFKNDNRPSPSALAHTLNAQVLLKNIDKNLYKYLAKIIKDKRYFDKFHTSYIYTQYALLVCFCDVYSEYKIGLDLITALINDILDYRKQNKLFSSIDKIEGTLEESAWAILGFHYYLQKINPKDTFIKKIIIETSIQINDLFNNVENLERLWIVKQIYTPYNINNLLLEVARNLHNKVK